MTTDAYGTCYFPSFNCAVQYYASQLYDEESVKQKLDAGTIRIGQPPPKLGWVSYLDESEGRWFKKRVQLKE